MLKILKLAARNLARYGRRTLLTAGLIILGIVAVLQRLIGEQIALPQRMMRGVARCSPGARAARDGADEELIGHAQCRERHDAEQHRGREAAGVRRVRRLDRGELLRNGARELRQECRRGVRVTVDCLVGVRRREAEVGRSVDDDELHARAGGSRQQFVDDLRRGAVWRGR